MPKRLLDGERLWRSDKIKRVEPESFRAEYANLLPLALADGSFECDPSLIWAQVYAYNRPSITPNHVKLILDEFNRVKLLFRWTIDNKLWGYWVGIQKDGLLPADAHAKRYKKGNTPPSDLLTTFINNNLRDNPEHIQNTSRTHPARFGLGLPLVSSWLGDDTDMKKSKISDLCVATGRSIPRGDDPSWFAISSLARVHGEREIVDAFEEFLKTDESQFPLSVFVGIATTKMHEESVPQQIGKKIAIDLVLLSDARVTFNQKQSGELALLLETYTQTEIESAFQEFLPTIDDYSQKFAGRDFTEKAEQLILAQRERTRKAKELASTIATGIAEEREKALAEIAANEAKRQAELASDDF